jgi:DNA polymerase III delta prime subunit
MKTLDAVWVEKYRPSNIDDVLSDKDVLSKFRQYIQEKDIPHLLFTGLPGCGKTTCAKIIANSITKHVLYVNASENPSVDTIRNKVANFCSTLALDGLKIVILDEFDGMSQASMETMRNTMEQYVKTSTFLSSNSKSM